MDRRLLANAALVHEGHCNGISCHLLDLLGQRRDLRPVLLVGRRDQDRKMHFESLRRLCPS
jgi:hypothetical protein